MNVRLSSLLCLLAGLVFCSLYPLAAQAQVSAAISGRVSDSTGAVIQGASVTAKDQDTGLTRSTLTDAAGRYELAALPVGQYEVRAAKNGFSERVRSGISLVIGQDANLDLTLAVGNVNQQVKVTGDAALVNATTQNISGLIGYAGDQGTAAEWTQLRPAAHAQSGNRKLHRGEDGWHRCFQLNHG